MEITRQQCEAMKLTLVASTHIGNSPIDINVTDEYVTEDGRKIIHQWGMGGETFTLV